MPFTASWRTLLDECEELAADATLITPLSETRFRLTDVQEHRIVIKFVDSGDSQPLQRDQFETLAERITDAGGTFEFQRLPPDAEPYAAVLSLHPRYEIDDQAGTITETDEPTTSQLIKRAATQPAADQDDATDSTEPDLDVYADMLLLIDALKRHDLTALEDCETPALINLYTLLSDVQRNAGDLRQTVREVLLGRLHHDQPVHGQYGSVQRTSRRNRSLKDDDEVLDVLEDAGIPRKRILAVDREKVDEALDVTELAESAVYEIEESEYVRKADVDEERKETRLQGLKDQLALSDDPDAEELRQEVDDLEQRIEELTEFKPGTEVESQS
ncbi:hypothetical protein [Halalkalicoccus sp. NIPERK01]|uniref:hypothetical protein n=1 Tax=Halalkalicoccus sp. NIPERK01 TaxID=3053469 RepID=UPI00256EA601|nr:hypothetical protein [Halalkalicoccus sp. NIPERK01]MDL5363927.1 hypothetical protein [Halalkalicoccus sp. NIPERK01]